MKVSASIDDLLRWQEGIAALPGPLAYIVIDPALATQETPFHGYDAKGKVYLVVSPSILDAMAHRNYADIPVLGKHIAPGLLGVPLVHRSDLPTGWPGASDSA